MAASEDSGAAPALTRAGRPFQIALALLITLGALAWAGDLYRDAGLLLFPEQFLAAILGCGLALVFIRYPLRRGTRRTHVPWYDWLAAAAGFGAGWYVAIAWEELSMRLTPPPADGLVVAVLLFLLSVEGLRRTIGYSLVAIVAFTFVYALVGHHMPGDLQTDQVDIEDLMIYLSLDSSGLLGLPLQIAATVVITFIFFGQLLLYSGGSQFFSDISMATMGRYRGGPGKISIVASSLFGSVSGVAVSNIVARGVVTIPLMKKSGFSPRLAAAIESVASTGGQLMPPVMGAVAFVMADFLRIPYQEVVVAAIFPSLLYYVAMFIQADLEAARLGLGRVEESLIPRVGRVMRSGWIFALPFAVLLYAMFSLNWQPEMAALAACGVIIGLGIALGYKGERMKFGDLWRSVMGTGLAVCEILMIVAAAGFIIGAFQRTGLGFALTNVIVNIGAGNLFVLLLVTAGMCILLGMGMPTLAVYVLLAVLIAPALVRVGIDPLAAHMFILYFGMMSLVTPPVAVASFFAAGLAGAPAMATGWTSVRFAWTAFVIPFLFIFSPSLLLRGDLSDLAVTLPTAVLGVWLISAAMIGYFIQRMTLLSRTGFTVAGVLLLLPKDLFEWGVWTDFAGLGGAALLALAEFLVSRRRRTALAGGAASSGTGPRE